MKLKSLYITVFIFLISISVSAGSRLPVGITSSWQEALQNKKASISILWYDIEPFIYRDKKNNIIGVEYELMQGFAIFLKNKYGIHLKNNWVDAGSFEAIYPKIKTSTEKGLFGVSFYSITNERKKDVKFSPAYMPDLNVLASSNNLPLYTNEKNFYKDLPLLKGFTMKSTTMEEDMLTIKKKYSKLNITNEADDYEVLKQISTFDNAIGYVPVSIYVVALQRGIKIKRQRILATRREGFAAIYTRGSDWDLPVNEYFESLECKMLVAQLIKKYLGREVAEIILEVSASDSIRGKVSDIELLTKEREIVTQRLIGTALEGERSKMQRNFFLFAAVTFLLFAGLMYSRYATKNKLSNLLIEKNKIIAGQKTEVLLLNEKLKIKILQSKLNPHFLFNSLNAIQYHINEDDRKGALNYISGFARFLRQFMKTSDEVLISTKDDALLVTSYLELEQKRFNDAFKFSVTIGEEAENAEIPPMLIHSILEEALYTRLLADKDIKNRMLDVSYLIYNSELVITIRDNGKPTEVQIKELEEKNALQVLQVRIEAINRAAENPIKISKLYNDEVNSFILKIPQPLFKN